MEHDSFNPECWCVPTYEEHKGVGVLIHNDTPPPRAVAEEGGIKYDQKKPPMELLDAEFLEGVAQVMAFGAEKYAAHNWRRGIRFSRLLGAALRHTFAILRGEDIDPESGLPHVHHLGCCAMFLGWMRLHRPDLDDRYTTTHKD